LPVAAQILHLQERAALWTANFSTSDGLINMQLKLDAIAEALSTMSDEDLEALQKDARQLAQIVTCEARRRRGTRGVGVVNVKGKNYSYYCEEGDRWRGPLLYRGGF
jgi:hypothetical protein